jgi:hypothetical protein
MFGRSGISRVLDVGNEIIRDDKMNVDGKMAVVGGKVVYVRCDLRRACYLHLNAQCRYCSQPMLLDVPIVYTMASIPHSVDEKLASKQKLLLV